MIAGGSGITPMLQIVRDVFKNESENTKISLLFANQTEQDILLRDEIENFKKEYPTRFSFMYTIDRPDENWQYQKGFINQGSTKVFSITEMTYLEMIGAFIPQQSENTMTLICGPPPMVKFACLPNLAANGHSENRIFVY